MKINKKISFIALSVAVVLFMIIWNFGTNEEGEHYRFSEVELGDVEYKVASTGQLSAVTTVQVGTQVSGIISKIFVDFNDSVEKGQVIALIDTTLLEISVNEAIARLQQDRAVYHQAKSAFERAKNLYQQKIVTDTEFDQARYNYESNLAALKLAEVSLERAKQNLSYATIIAPVSGTVIERNVDVGQTVAASFSAPQLFLIANDLTEMQILVSVDESDIGLIKQGQKVRFNVQAYADDIFTGLVRQVRLQSKVEENVVSYTVVVDVKNEDGKLLPGMTATVDFLVESAQDIFKIANTALRFRPTDEMRDLIRENYNQKDKHHMGEGNGGDEKIQKWKKQAKNIAMLWYVNENNSLDVMRVHTGISDGQMTEIRGESISEGLQVISGIIESKPADMSNPFQNRNRGRRRGGF